MKGEGSNPGRRCYTRAKEMTRGRACDPKCLSPNRSVIPRAPFRTRFEAQDHRSLVQSAQLAGAHRASTTPAHLGGKAPTTAEQSVNAQSLGLPLSLSMVPVMSGAQRGTRSQLPLLVAAAPSGTVQPNRCASLPSYPNVNL